MALKPFIKWVGGKTQLIDIIDKNITVKDNISTYIEPFIGGGSVLFNIVPKLPNVQNVIISDINTGLVNLYNVIKENPQDFLNNIKQLEKLYLYKTDEDKQSLFYQLRDEYNSCNADYPILYATIFLFLNKTCFNGLYRENKKGEFNTPWNKSKKPCFFIEEDIMDVHRFLNDYNVTILNDTYDNVIKNYALTSNNTFVYLDPPYRPISKSSAFTAYSKSSFNDDNQKELASWCDKIHESGNYFMLSNSDPKNTNPNDNFFDDLYGKYNIQRVPAKRSINSKGDKRGEINEILVKNF